MGGAVRPVGGADSGDGGKRHVPAQQARSFLPLQRLWTLSSQREEFFLEKAEVKLAYGEGGGR